MELSCFDCEKMRKSAAGLCHKMSAYMYEKIYNTYAVRNVNKMFFLLGFFSWKMHNNLQQSQTIGPRDLKYGSLWSWLKKKKTVWLFKRFLYFGKMTSSKFWILHLFNFNFGNTQKWYVKMLRSLIQTLVQRVKKCIIILNMEHFFYPS